MQSASVLVPLLGVLFFLSLFYLLASVLSKDGEGEYKEIDGDVIYADKRVNEMLYAHNPEDEEPTERLDFDPAETKTVRCPSCDAINEATYSFCRRCVAQLQEIDLDG